uniref:ANK_REP_REGION domain-containing protein n=1 Tax=Meloidogyne incognita TaxID=6306 RepID=A0A914MG34_MELIC
MALRIFSSPLFGSHSFQLTRGPVIQASTLIQILRAQQEEKLVIDLCVNKMAYTSAIPNVIDRLRDFILDKPHELLNSTKFFPQSSSSSTFSFDNTEEIKLFKSTQSDGSANKSIAINEAFQAATERGFTSICSLFLEYDKNQEKPILDTSGALSTACINSHSDLIQLFLSRGIQPPQNGNISWKGRLALNCAVESGCLDLVVKILNNEGNTIINEQEGPEGFTPLITAAKQGRVGLVDLLVNRGANMDKTDIQGRSAIFHALEDGHFSTAGLLLEKGCNPCIADINENTLLHILAKRPNRGLIGQLLEMGISLEGSKRKRIETY